jgi:serine/threonine-protein kinase
MAEIGQVIGGYKLQKLLYPGQRSLVFEVVEPTSHRHFAMKLLLPEYAGIKADRAVMFHEADVGIKMRHENVINILKVSRSPKEPHFIMEFFPSGSLRGRLQSKDPKDKEFLRVNAKKIFKQAATGLAYMNASGFVHADVKPDNILVNAIGQTKIIDFAITKRVQKGVFAKLFHRRRKPQGTPSYMSPEQIQDNLLDGRADVYSFGATLFELVTGRKPFVAASQNDLLRKHLTEKPPTPIAYNPDVTDGFAALVLKMMAKKKEDRFANFHEVLIELKKVPVFKSVVESDEDKF